MTIKTIIEENKKKAELSIFWQEMSTYLPKTLEREAFGDHKIFKAFALTYPSIKKYLLSTLLDEIEKEIKEKDQTIIIENTKIVSNVIFAQGYQEALEDILSTLNKYRV